MEVDATSCQKWVVVYLDVECFRDRNVRNRERGGEEMDWDPPLQPLFSVHLDLLFYIKYDWLKSNK
jgi:hypothetical protein